MIKNIDMNPSEAAIAAIVVDSEYKTARRNQDAENGAFESLIGMLECKRNEKGYDWMSDYYPPEMNAIFHTERAGEVAQYFPTRDFVEVKLDGDNEADEAKARGAKKCINKTLNDRSIFYYPKFVRLRSINSLFGRAYIVARWDQKTVKETAIGVDAKGKRVGVERDRTVYDRFNFEVYDPRNVFTDNKYCYSVQQKGWITFRTETTLGQLEADKDANQYINLDKVESAIEGKKPTETETGRDTYNQDGDFIQSKTPVVAFDMLDRFGTFYAVVTERDLNGNPTKITSGYSDAGTLKDNAELVETIISFALIGSQKIMVRFIPTPYIDTNGTPFKPVVRSLCYVHPTKDCGIGDGQHMQECQIALGDTFNMSMDRTKLATIPTFMGRKGFYEDNASEVYIEPEHIIPFENPDDLKPLQIPDNVDGALRQYAMLSDGMNRAMSIFPPNMGGLPDKASTTATAVAGAEASKNTRMNYKSMTVEYVFFQEFYWMILQMFHLFAKSETALKMLGEDAYSFDADANYTYTPVSSNIETEYNKYKKVQLYDQAIGRLSGMVQSMPALVPIIAHMVGRQFSLLGDEFQIVGEMVDKLSKSKPQEEGKQGEQVKDAKDDPTSNQNGQPISPMEASAREGAMTAGGSIK